MDAPDACPGWFGKLPSLGDFASRRLPPDFIEPWDAWLSEGLGQWRQAQPEDWLPAYLASPSWMFLLFPDALQPGAVGWAGVLMPSVDRVGRYFPLTLAQALPGWPCGAEDWQTLQRGLLALDDLAVDALHEDWSVDQLEAALARHGLPRPEDAPDPTLPWQTTAGPLGRLDEALAELARPRLPATLRGMSAWWCQTAGGPSPLRLCRGLPPAPDFPRLFQPPAAAA